MSEQQEPLISSPRMRDMTVVAGFVVALTAFLMGAWSVNNLQSLTAVTGAVNERVDQGQARHSDLAETVEALEARVAALEAPAADGDEATAAGDEAEDSDAPAVGASADTEAVEAAAEVPAP